MSGRHKMPPAGRRKAAAESAETPEQVNLEKTAVEPPAPDPESATPEAVEPESTTSEATEPEPEGAEPQDTAQMDPQAPESPEGPESPEVAEDPEVSGATDEPDATEEPTADNTDQPARTRSRVPLVLAVIALVLASACGVLRWLIVTQHESDTARTESVEAAKDITIQMLSYETDTVDQQLTAARDRMTGEFLGKYTAMIDQVIPAAHAQQISAVADVQSVGVVSAEPDRAEVMMYVDQSVQVGRNVPERTLSIVRATVVKDGDQWLLSRYEPVQP